MTKLITLSFLVTLLVTIVSCKKKLSHMPTTLFVAPNSNGLVDVVVLETWSENLRRLGSDNNTYACKKYRVLRYSYASLEAPPKATLIEQKEGKDLQRPSETSVRNQLGITGPLALSEIEVPEDKLPQWFSQEERDVKYYSVLMGAREWVISSLDTSTNAVENSGRMRVIQKSANYSTLVSEEKESLIFHTSDESKIGIIGYPTHLTVWSFGDDKAKEIELPLPEH